MLKLVSSSQALAADRTAERDFGYPSWMLMEEAGIRLQERLETLVAAGSLPSGPVVYLVGAGNNGGDALVMARQAHLRGQSSVAAVGVLEPRSASSQAQWALAQAVGVPCFGFREAAVPALLASAVLWVDGIWGTGLNRRLGGEAGERLKELESLRRMSPALRVVAVDLPSGLWSGWSSDDPVLAATYTLVPGWHKDFTFYPELRPFLGLPSVLPLAFPRAAESGTELLEAADLAPLLPPFSIFDHKGRRGRIALVGGCLGMTGAVVLAARSAAAAGAGVVTLGLDEDLVPLVAPQVAAFQVRGRDEWLSRSRPSDAVVVGPGWGQAPNRVAALNSVWNLGGPLVVDADALLPWAASGLGAGDRPVVLTPHPGEFARLDAGGGPSVEAAARLAALRGVTVVLKGAVTWIVSADGRRSVWDGPNPALGTAGSGDCLAGVIGALLAAGLDGHQAGCAGVLLHALAGRELLAQKGWFLADDLPEAISRVSASCRMPSGPL